MSERRIMKDKRSIVSCYSCGSPKVAMARQLAVRLYWMWRQGWNYEQVVKFGSHAGQPGNRDGVQ
jgi:hypothetical protein